MKDKLTYIILGVGAGVLAYYLLCRRKVNENNFKDVELTNESLESENKKTDTTSKFIPVMPKYTTPIATTTPLVVNVTNTTPKKVEAQVLSPLSSTTTKPTTTQITPTSTTIAPTTSTTNTTNTTKLAFDGSKICFEVGDCLTDI